MPGLHVVLSELLAGEDHDADHAAFLYQGACHAGDRSTPTSFVHSDESPSRPYTWNNFLAEDMTLPPPIPTSNPHSQQNPAALAHLQQQQIEQQQKTNKPRQDGVTITSEEREKYVLPLYPYSAQANAYLPPPAPPIEDSLDGEYTLPESYSTSASTMLMPPERWNAGTKYRLLMQENLFKTVIYGTSIAVFGFAFGVHNMVMKLQRKNIDDAMIEELNASLLKSEIGSSGSDSDNSDSSGGSGKKRKEKKLDEDSASVKSASSNDESAGSDDEDDKD
ncbi:unnamed protein product [Amoebophrya sp. A120]|nr:unnamed protein product [Amoebophrya sp. A120]|eukprot:GSA120T00009861001.1